MLRGCHAAQFDSLRETSLGRQLGHKHFTLETQVVNAVLMQIYVQPWETTQRAAAGEEAQAAVSAPNQPCSGETLQACHHVVSCPTIC